MPSTNVPWSRTRRHRLLLRNRDGKFAYSDQLRDVSRPEIRTRSELLKALAAPNVHFTETVEQCKAINRISGYFIVIAASGMCDAGDIRHHLRAHLWRREGALLLVGFQAQVSWAGYFLMGPHV